MINIFDDIDLAFNKLFSRREHLHAYPDHILRGVEEIFGLGVSPEDAVAKVLSDVKNNGDRSLEHWSKKIDGIFPDPLIIESKYLSKNFDNISDKLRSALILASERIRNFHALQPNSGWDTKDLGGVMGQRIVPLDRVGIYVPGGTASLPSSLLMAAIPAQVANVKEIVVCTPPQNEKMVVDVVQATAHMLGINEIYQLGGAQAIAAMAYGTETIRPVDKIVGPGNLFVTLAKSQVFGNVGIDGLYGPTETIIISDDSMNPDWIAADLLAQAEHDPLATSILITTSCDLANSVKDSVIKRAQDLKRKDIIQQSFANRGGILIVPEIETAINIVNQYAPEHLCLYLHDAEKWSEKIFNAGCLFIGKYSCEVLVDYVAGPNHVLPTGGTAKFASPLNVSDFTKIMNVVTLDQNLSKALAESAAEIAFSELLDGHAYASLDRKE